MESMLLRTGSGSLPVQTPSPRNSVSLPIQDSVTAGAFSGDKTSGVSFPRISLLHHTEMSRRNIRRASSEPDLVHSLARSLTSNLGSRSFTAPRLVEEKDVGGRNNNNNNGNFPGGGGNGSGGDHRRIGAYYQEMLRTDPTNSLLLRNYGKYLHEVEKDAVKAEEYYGRAILASPGDGEVLWLYAKLTWETQRDKERANCYFNQALQASPNNSTIMGSYAHFLWEAELDDDEDDDREILESSEEEETAIPEMVEAL